MQILMKVLVCEDEYGETRLLTVTACWTPEQARARADKLGFKPLYIVNVYGEVR